MRTALKLAALVALAGFVAPACGDPKDGGPDQEDDDTGDGIPAIGEPAGPGTRGQSMTLDTFYKDI